MRGKFFIYRVAIVVMVSGIFFGCTANRKNTYCQYLLTGKLTHNDSFVQQVFGSTKTEIFVTGRFMIVQQNVQFLEDSIIHKDPKYAYYIINTLSGKQQAVNVYTDFEADMARKDYEVFTKDSIERKYFFKGFLKSLELEKYQRVNVNEQANSFIHSFAGKGPNFNNRLAPDSVVIISSANKNVHFPFLAFKDNQQITQIELHEKISGNQLNSLFMLLTKVTANYQSATIDSILNKYKEIF